MARMTNFSKPTSWAMRISSCTTPVLVSASARMIIVAPETDQSELHSSSSRSTQCLPDGVLERAKTRLDVGAEMDP